MKFYYVIIVIVYFNVVFYVGYVYEYIVIDVIVWFKWLDCYDVCFLIGIDEYGLKVV